MIDLIEKDWGMFKIGKLFDIRPTKYYKLTNSKLLHDDGKNPVVVNSSYNNGIGGFSNLDITENGNIITFSDTTSAEAVFYQENPFVGYSHVQGMYPTGKYQAKWSKNCLLFLLAVFKKKASDLGFDYVNKFTREIAKEIMIKLPIDEDSDPDWEYMNLYILSLTGQVKIKVANFLKYTCIQKDKNDLAENWKYFHLYDIFDIDSGNKFDKSKMDTKVEIINFVGRSNFNNGVTQKVNLVDGIQPYNEGCLTLALGGAYLGSCFIQEAPFYTSQNVVVLIPKNNLSFETMQFIATTIFVESQNNYEAFIKELNKHIKKDFKIKLPVNEQNEIDIVYMDNFIKSLHSKSNDNIMKIYGKV